MTTALESRTTTVVLLGNPNTGKSTLFSALAGVRQRVGNYPGVTVEKKIGQMTHGGRLYSLIDLPGTYSLAPRSPDEMVAVDVLLGRQTDALSPDAILCIVDASNLERNLYMVSQALEFGKPVVVALNMIDVAQERGIRLDCEKLRRHLGVAVVEIQAHRREGLDELRSALAEAVGQAAPRPASIFPEVFQVEVERLEASILENGNGSDGSHQLPRYLVERLILDSGGYIEEFLADRLQTTHWKEDLRSSRERLAAAGAPVPAIEAMARYAWVAKVLEGVVTRPSDRPRTFSDRVDRLLTHRFWGMLIFVALMMAVFQAIFRWSELPVGWVESLVAWVSRNVESMVTEGPFQRLLVDGVVAGVGAVLVFLPQILILFFFLAILEDCGYMARAAYLMDRLMVRMGLSGKSFIPLLSSFACAVPGVMATRVIENRRDRLATMLIAPLMSCSARLPVYSLMIGAFIPPVSLVGGVLDLRGLTMVAMYAVGIVTAVIVAWLLKRSLLKGATPPFVLELPSYKWPSPITVIHRVLDRAKDFVFRAGKLIIAVSVVIWASSYYPRDSVHVEAKFAAQREALRIQGLALAEEGEARADHRQANLALDRAVAAEYQRRSWLGRAGQWIEPMVKPLGWDWRIGCAAIASFPAREVVVATLGVLFQQDGEGEGEEDQKGLREALRSARWEEDGRPLFTVPVALSIMVFFALCAQCVATLAVIQRETRSWFWPLFTFSYMTILAYIAAFLTYQIGTWLGA